MIKLEADGQIDLEKPIPMFVEVLRWGEPDYTTDSILARRYIVESASEDEVKLVFGDWDEDGRVKFQSVKHGYLIRGKEKVDALRAALELMGPREWRPKGRER